jgi:hypothetical protein
LAQLGFELKAVYEAFTHMPVLFVLKIHPESPTLSDQLAEKVHDPPAEVEDAEMFEATGGVPSVVVKV